MNRLIVVTGLSMFLFFSHAIISYAHELGPQDIQTLKESADRLKLTDPNLSNELNKYADREATGTEEADENEQHNIELLNHASKALHHWPELTDRLKKIADKEAQEEKK